MKQDEVFVRHILDETNFLIYKSKGLEIVGEATKNISLEFREKHPAIEWRELPGLRDKLIHRYFGVKWEIVWDVVESKIPQIKQQIEDILKEIETR